MIGGSSRGVRLIRSSKLLFSETTGSSELGHPVKIDTSEVATALEIGSREPFTKELARWFNAAPSSAAIRRMAEKRPDRWVQAIAVLARLAGYNDRTESVSLSLFANIKNMSDAELEEELASLQQQLEALQRPRVEVEESKSDQPRG